MPSPPPPGPAAELDLSRLIKLLGMLGSAQAGERAAAALKVTEFLQARSLTWDEVFSEELGAVSVSVGAARPVGGYTEGYAAGLAAAVGLAEQRKAAAYLDGFRDGARAAQPGPQPATTPTPRTWRDALQEALHRLDTLVAQGRTREADFVKSLPQRYGTLSPKQEYWLRDICLRLGIEQW